MAGRKRGFSEILPRGTDEPVRIHLATDADRSTVGRYWNHIRAIVEGGPRADEARRALHDQSWRVRPIDEVDSIPLETRLSRIDQLADAGELSFEDLDLE